MSHGKLPTSPHSIPSSPLIPTHQVSVQPNTHTSNTHTVVSTMLHTFSNLAFLPSFLLLSSFPSHPLYAYSRPRFLSYFSSLQSFLSLCHLSNAPLFYFKLVLSLFSVVLLLSSYPCFFLLFFAPLPVLSSSFSSEIHRY